MKKNLLLFLFVSFTYNAVSQPGTEELVLSVEKGITYSNVLSTVNLKFKPDKLLKIKTTEGRKFISRNYLFLDSAIVMINSKPPLTVDSVTIPVNDITMIKGKVHDNAGRKIAGGIIALSAPPLGFFPVFAVAYGGGPAFLVALPFVGISAAGISMMGARRFNTADTWTLKMTSQ